MSYKVCAGELVDIPLFADGLELTHVTYRLMAIVHHLGGSPHSGHYIAALSVTGTACRMWRPWKFQVADDGHALKDATSYDLR